MANRYQPPKSMTALEVLRHGKAMYPDSEIGDEMGVSPEVYLRGTHDRLDAYAGGIESKRKFAVGAGKAAWELHKHGGFKKLIGEKAVAPVLKEMTDIHGKSWIAQTSPGSKATGLRGKVAQLGESNLGKFASKTGGKIAAGAKDFAFGFDIGAKNLMAKGAPHAMSASSSTAMAKIGAAAPPLLAAVAISKLIGSTKMGKQWTKSTNKHLKGRFKNLLSPWKWRL